MGGERTVQGNRQSHGERSRSGEESGREPWVGTNGFPLIKKRGSVGFNLLYLQNNNSILILGYWSGLLRDARKNRAERNFVCVSAP